MGERLSERLQRGQMSVSEATFIAGQVAGWLIGFQRAGAGAYGALTAAVVSVDDIRVTGIDRAVDRPADASEADDVFALGQLIYQMVTGFPTASAASMLPLRDDVPPALDVLTQSMLASQPTDRPSLESVSQQLATYPPPTPDETAPLQALLEQQRQAGQWSESIETITQLVQTETVLDRQAAWSFLGAQICRDELGDLDHALEFCAYALNLRDWSSFTTATVESALAPFRMIESMLTESGDAKALERAMRNMIVRIRDVPALATFHAGLCDKLGDIYFAKLGSSVSAKSAFEMARSLDPTNEARTVGVDRDAMLAQLADVS